jgi:hypothetical protein
MAELHRGDGGGPGAEDDLAAAYGFALRRYARTPSEHGLETAYELGRSAVRGERSVLELAVAHHSALLAALRAARGADVAAITGAAADFFVEALSAYEMQGRGFRETHDRARAERRQAEMLRRLSTFLADASQTGDGSAPGEEILRLVAEQARELTGARSCVASARRSPEGATIRAVAHGDPIDADGDGHAADAWQAEPWSLTLAAAPPPDGPADGLVAPIAVAGRAVGELAITGDDDGTFTAVDQAVLTHLAQMTASALDRAWRDPPVGTARLRSRRRRVRLVRGA